MGIFRRAKIAAFKARLLKCEAERRRIVQMVDKTLVPLAEIAERVRRVEDEVRVLTRELKSLEMPEPEE